MDIPEISSLSLIATVVALIVVVGVSLLVRRRRRGKKGAKIDSGWWG